MRATLDALRQTVTMIVMNAQIPDPNYTPSSAAQVFVTNAELSAAITAQTGRNLVGAAAAPAYARAALARGAPTKPLPLPVQVVEVNLDDPN